MTEAHPVPLIASQQIHQFAFDSAPFEPSKLTKQQSFWKINKLAKSREKLQIGRAWLFDDCKKKRNSEIYTTNWKVLRVHLETCHNDRPTTRVRTRPPLRNQRRDLSRQRLSHAWIPLLWFCRGIHRSAFAPMEPSLPRVTPMEPVFFLHLGQKRWCRDEKEKRKKKEKKESKLISAPSSGKHLFHRVPCTLHSLHRLFTVAWSGRLCGNLRGVIFHGDTSS